MVQSSVSVPDDVDHSRRKFLTDATIAVGAVGAIFVAVPFVESWLPSERARALGGPVKLDVSKIDPGQMTIVVWRLKPIYIVRRTPAMLARLDDHDARLKDPKSEDSNQPPYAKNAVRARRADTFVTIGICTHLGCLPKARFAPDEPELGANWPGGFFCPCHGSRFDLAGRVFDGSPASVNLVIPPYAFADEWQLVVGNDNAAKEGS
jgi:ubiquinol-cytochrome c reductase iron-sulfur subunit